MNLYPKHCFEILKDMYGKLVFEFDSLSWATKEDASILHWIKIRGFVRKLNPCEKDFKTFSCSLARRSKYKIRKYKWIVFFMLYLILMKVLMIRAFFVKYAQDDLKILKYSINDYCYDVVHSHDNKHFIVKTSNTLSD